MKTPAERQRIERLLDVHRDPAGHAEGLEAEDAAARELYGEYVAEHGHEGAVAALEELYAAVADVDDGIANLSDPVTVVVTEALERAEEAAMAWADGEDTYADPELRPGDDREADDRRYRTKRDKQLEQVPRTMLRVWEEEHGRIAPAALTPTAPLRRGARARGAGTPAGRARTRSSTRGGDSGDGSSEGGGDDPPPPGKPLAAPSGRPETEPAQNPHAPVVGRFRERGPGS